MKTPLLAVALAMCAAVSAATEDVQSLTLFWVSKPDSLAGPVGRSDRNTSAAGVDNTDSRHPNSSKSNQWIGSADGSELQLTEGKTVNLFLKNADLDTHADFILHDENNQELVHVLVYATSGADTFVSSRHYSLKGKIVKIAASVACDGAEKTSGEFDGPICLKLPVLPKDMAQDPVPAHWSAIGCWGGVINGQCGASTPITIVGAPR